MSAKVTFYVGTGYTAESGGEAIISCAGKLYSNCKFFPESLVGTGCQFLAVSSDPTKRLFCRVRHWVWKETFWQNFGPTRQWRTSGFAAWTQNGSAERAGWVVKTYAEEAYLNGEMCNFWPYKRYRMYGYVPVAMRPESEWGETESAWIHQWLEHTYGRTD